jgi:hypothetical protein
MMELIIVERNQSQGIVYKSHNKGIGLELIGIKAV